MIVVIHKSTPKKNARAIKFSKACEARKIRRNKFEHWIKERHSEQEKCLNFVQWLRKDAYNKYKKSIEDSEVKMSWLIRYKQFDNIYQKMISNISYSKKSAFLRGISYLPRKLFP
jgi:hypothetical protein